MKTGNRRSRALAAQITDLGLAVPQVLAHRVTRMARSPARRRLRAIGESFNA